ncbi:MAG TPA: rRNA maturation RNase YbeY, partial [Candidatus Acidoferrales bacterium]|nr:rRNA maturation RNase YbeY [Candidatus Acidoferrales bacterium]
KRLPASPLRVVKRPAPSRAPMILNRQSAARVSVPGLDRFLERVARKLGIAPGALTVCLVTNAQMARWNRAFRRKTGPTDVLSFPADEANAGEQSRRGSRRRASVNRTKNRLSSTSFNSSTSSTSYLGDIAIAPAVARRNARRFGRTLRDELCILILHGALHLMGYDHETDQGQMDRFEQRLRRSLGLA